MRRADSGAAVLMAFAGASAWISFGTLAVADQNQARLGALPPLWALVPLVALAIACAWLARLRTSEAWPLSLTALLWTPWLPASVPAALLIWQGPLEWLVWLVAIGGVAVARLAAASHAPAWWNDARRAPWIAAAVCFVCSIGAGVALRADLPGGDEPHYLVITQSLLYDGDLRIENNHDRGDFVEYTYTPIRPDFLQRGKDGHIYSVHAPGLPALLLPAYALAGYPGALVFVAAIAAAAVALLWKIAFDLSASVSAAWAATLAVGFSATFFLHSFSIFPDPIGAFAVTAALIMLMRLEIARDAVAARHLLIAGSCLALLPWLHTRFSVVAAMFGVVFLLRLLKRPASAFAFALVPLLSAAAWFWFFYAIYGSPNPTAPYGEGRQSATEWIPTGLAGLVFDQQFGLLANAPVLVFSAFGLLTLWRTRRRLAIELVVIAVPYILAVAAFAMWWGGWSAPARFVACLMPLASPLLAAAWSASTVAGRSLFVAATIVGTANVWARVTFERGALVYNFRDGFDLLLDWASRTINLPLAFPSLHRLGTEPTLLLGSIWIVSAGVALIALQFCVARRAVSSGERWALTAWIVSASATLAMAASWRATRTNPLTPESSLIEFTRHWKPDRRPMAIRLPSLSMVDADSALSEIELRSSVRVRDRGDDRPLLALTRVPAGEYVVVVDGSRDLEGELTVSIGATSQSVERWSLDGTHPGDALRLRLPSLVHSVTIKGDDRAKASIRHLALQPARVFADDPVNGRYAIRAARYAATRVFFLDDAMYMEPAGVWTRGDATGEFVIATDAAASVDVDVTAGPARATLEFLGPAALPPLTLAPGERRRLQLTNGLWRVTTRGRFRPKDYEASSRDARPLGVRLEFPSTPAQDADVSTVRPRRSTSQ